LSAPPERSLGSPEKLLQSGVPCARYALPLCAACRGRDPDGDADGRLWHPGQCHRGFGQPHDGRHRGAGRDDRLSGQRAQAGRLGNLLSSHERTGEQRYLHIVGRHFQEGRTRWSLTKIDPRLDTILWTASITLSSSTRHVMVVPGPKHWAWIEKGAPRGLFDQNVERIPFLSSEWLRNFSNGEERKCR
jgi:hypothetical protein